MNTNQRFSICGTLRKQDCIELLKNNLSFEELNAILKPNYNQLMRLIKSYTKKENQFLLYNTHKIGLDKITAIIRQNSVSGIVDNDYEEELSATQINEDFSADNTYNTITETALKSKLNEPDTILINYEDNEKKIIINEDNKKGIEIMKDNTVINASSATQSTKKIKINNEAVNNETELCDIEIIETITKVGHNNEASNNIKNVKILEKCLITKEDYIDIKKPKDIDIDKEYNFKDIQMELINCNLSNIQIQEYFSIKQKEYIPYLIDKYKMKLEYLNKMSIKDIYEIMRIHFYEERA